LTNIVVIVVAADDGIKQQTIEAINHAKDSKVPIIVAITKIDKGDHNVEMIKSQLTEH
jgi:translation initiation factor IF-2